MLFFIVNPIAGSGRALKVEALLKAEMERRGIPCQFIHTEKAGQAESLARKAAAQDDCSAVISIGGDGTQLEVARGLFGSGKPMGMIPAGTGNDLIKTLGIPKDPMESLSLILQKTPRPMDVGTVNGQLFLNVCGTGFDVRVLDEAERFKKHTRGLIPYLCGLICAIFGHKGVKLRYTADGETHEDTLLLCSVANGRYIGGGIPICPDASPDDGFFDLVVVRDVPRHKIPRYLPALMNQKVLDLPFTIHKKARHVEIDSEGMRLQIDGEITTMNRAVFDIKPGQLLLYR